MKKLLTILALAALLCMLCSVALATEEPYIGKYTEDEIAALTTVTVKGKTYTVDSTNLGTVKANNGHNVEAAVKVYYTDGGVQYFVTATVNVNPHKWNAGTVTTQPTCISKGVTTYKCTICGETKTENVPNKLAGHDAGYVYKTKTEPTCVSDGESAKYCPTCKVWIPNTEAKIDRTYNHAYGWVLGVVPNCGADRSFPKNGTMTLVCQYCGKNASDLDPVNYPAATNTNVKIDFAQMQANSWIKDPSYDGHDWVNWVPGDKPTCLEYGTKIRWCKICQLKEETTDWTQAPIGHDWAVKNPETITCMSTSVTFECIRQNCDVEETKSTHNWKDDKVFNTEKTVFVTPKHVYVENDKYYDLNTDGTRKVYPATCTTPAYTLQHCIYETEGPHPTSLVGFGLTGELRHYQGEALGHDWTAWNCLAAPGTSGNEEGLWVRTCRRCTKVEQHASKYAPADLCAAHEYEVTSEPTCTEAGEKTCKLCGKIEEVKALGHDYKTIVEEAATCTKEGKGTKICNRCNDVVKDAVIEKLPHTPGEPEVTPATTEKEGSKVVKCTVCGEVLSTEVLPKELGETEFTAEVKFGEMTLTGKADQKEGTKEAEAVYARVTYFMADGTYVVVSVPVEADGTFESMNSGNVIHVSVQIVDSAKVRPGEFNRFGGAEFDVK